VLQERRDTELEPPSQVVVWTAKVAGVSATMPIVQASGKIDGRHVRHYVCATTAVIAAATVLGLGLRLGQLAQPGFLMGVTEYDDGVYFGDAVQMAHGALPYRDFVAVHPPGIMLLMAPLAVLSKTIGTANGLAVARVLTACVGAANIMLLGWLLRHRGALSVAVACGLLAVFPDGVAAAHTLLLEPWLMLFCLAAMVAAFDGDALRRRKRLWWGGAAFGFACAIKLWAIVPVLALAVLCLRRRRTAVTFGIGVASGFLVPIFPFAATAPKSFINSVVIAQLSRVDAVRVPTWRRLASMTGLTYADIGSAMVLAVSVALAILIIFCYARAALIAGHSPSALQWLALATTVSIVTAFLYPADFYYHYTAFLVPFLAITLAPPIAGLVATKWARRTRYTGAGLALVVIAMLTVTQVRNESTAKHAYNPARAAERVIPPGACVLTDTASFTIAANRFVSTMPDCPVLVDAIGTDYSLSHGHNGVTGADQVPAVRQLWAAAFAHAQYVWLSDLNRRRIAWTPPLTTYFRTHFQPVHTPGAPPGLYIRMTEPAP
jgi:glycosyl transferase family 87